MKRFNSQQKALFGDDEDNIRKDRSACSLVQVNDAYEKNAGKFKERDGGTESG